MRGKRESERDRGGRKLGKYLEIEIVSSQESAICPVLVSEGLWVYQE